MRHFSGKIYVHLFNSKPRLYFYPHSPGWFKRSFDFSKNIQFYCWRSTNKYFLNLYVHKILKGEKLLGWLMKLEDKYSKFLGIFGRLQPKLSMVAAVPMLFQWQITQMRY
jgi:hypothetical protein